MLSVKVYVIGCVAAVGGYLALNLSVWFLLLFGGALVATWWTWQQERRQQFLIKQRESVEMRKLEADARAVEAEAALKVEAVHRARSQRGLIPAGYIGAQLYRAQDTALYQVWGEIQRKYTTPAVTVREEADAPALLPTLPRAEPFSRLLPEIERGHLILGYNLDGAIAGDISDLLSTAIVGRPGTGKTTALRFVCAQVLCIGGRPVLFDPHGSIADEVGDMLECAEDGAAMQQLAAALEDELDARITARRAKESPRPPLLLLADEWPVISQLAPEAVRITGRVVLEGRKVGMYALISGQGLPSDQLGGSLVRDALSSRYVFNTTPAQARMAGMDNETAKLLLAQLETAGPGYAILASARRSPEIIAIPQTTVADMRAILGDVPPVPPLPMKEVSPSSLSEAEVHLSAPTPRIRGEKRKKQEREQILALHRQGFAAYIIARQMGKASAYTETIKQVIAEAEGEAS